MTTFSTTTLTGRILHDSSSLALLHASSRSFLNYGNLWNEILHKVVSDVVWQHMQGVVDA